MNTTSEAPTLGGFASTVIDLAERRDSRAAYYAERRRQMAYRTWAPSVDAAPVREHLLHLRRTGMSTSAIASVSGVPVQTLWPLAQGSRARARRATAQAVFAVRPSRQAGLDVEERLTARLRKLARAAGAASEELRVADHAPEPVGAAFDLALESAAGCYQLTPRQVAMAARPVLARLGRLTVAERRLLAVLLHQRGLSGHVLAALLGVSPSTVSRDLQARGASARIEGAA